MESFFHSLKTEVIHRRAFHTVGELGVRCGTTSPITIARDCIRRWAIDHPLTMSASQLKVTLSTEVREDPRHNVSPRRAAQRKR